MKKIGLVLVSLVVTILVSGCGGNKKLICTKKDSGSNYIQEQKMAVTVKNEQIKKMEVISNTDFDGVSDEEIKTTYELLKNIMDNFDSDGIDTEVTMTKQTVKSVISIDFDKAKEEDVKQFTSNYSKDKNDKIKIENIRKQMEKEGYTCK